MVYNKYGGNDSKFSPQQLRIMDEAKKRDERERKEYEERKANKEKIISLLTKEKIPLTVNDIVDKLGIYELDGIKIINELVKSKDIKMNVEEKDGVHVPHYSI